MVHGDLRPGFVAAEPHVHPRRTELTSDAQLLAPDAVDDQPLGAFLHPYFKIPVPDPLELTPSRRIRAEALGVGRGSGGNPEANRVSARSSSSGGTGAPIKRIIAA